MDASTLSKEALRRLRIAIRDVLLQVWDPIGIKDEPNAQDEYDGYVGDICGLLISAAPDSEIANYLDWVTHSRMGFEESEFLRMATSHAVVALKKISLI